MRNKMNIDISKSVKEALKLNSVHQMALANYEARMDYNRVGFILQSVLPILDRLVESTQTKYALKKAVKDLIFESEKFIGGHHEAYEKHSPVEQVDGEESELIQTRDIYNITAKAYDYIVECLYNDKPNEILSKKQLIDQFLAAGGNLEDVNIPFKPVDLNNNK